MIKIVTSFSTLLRLARNLSNAEANGNKELIAKAKAAHDSYRDLCLKADGMQIHTTCGNL